TDEIKQKLRYWTTGQAKDRIAEQLEFDAHAEKLASHLKTADSFLETSIEAIRGIQMLATLDDAFGTQLEPAPLDETLKKIESVRSKLLEFEESVQNVRDLVADKGEGSRLGQAVKFAARALVTFSDLDTRLQNAENRLGELRTEAI